MHFRGPGPIRVVNCFKQLRERRPPLGCCLRWLNNRQVIEMSNARYLLEDFGRRGGADAGQELKDSEARDPISWVLTPPKSTENILNMCGLKEPETAVLDEWNIPPGKFDLKQGAVMGSSK